MFAEGLMTARVTRFVLHSFFLLGIAGSVLLTLVLLFSFKGEVILGNPLTILWIVVVGIAVMAEIPPWFDKV